jgi:hypothetical protein
MSRPGVDVISQALPVSPTVPTNTGVGFVIGTTGVTPTGPGHALVHSMTEYESTFGARTGQEVTYDAADVFFREGGSQLWVSSTTSTAAAAAEAEAEPPARARRAGNGEAGTLAAADTGVVTALGRLSKTLGPGQVFIADPVLAAAAANQSALLAHAAASNRVALLSTTDGTAATLIAAGQGMQADANAQYGALFAPSAIVPGVTPGTTRTVPWAAVQAGIIARNDVTLDPNIASAGDNGVSLYAIGLYAASPAYTDTDYANLNAAGVDMARFIYGVIECYGYRSLANPQSGMATWLEFGNCRLAMAITADAEAIGEGYVFAQLDGRGVTIADFGGELSAMLSGYWNDGALYGATAQDAFSVNVGPSVNTPTTIANGELHAILEVRMSTMAEWVQIAIVKVPTTQPLAPPVPSGSLEAAA